jgi:hypothetical protein
MILLSARAGKAHVSPVVLLIPASKAVNRRASKPRWISFPIIVALVVEEEGRFRHVQAYFRST